MLTIGLKNIKRCTVTEVCTASSIGSGTLPVYATPAMAALMEATAAESVEPLLEAGATSVGTMLHLRHLAADPIGVSVCCESELTGIDGRRLTFRLTVRDREEVVGEAVHERCIVSAERFMNKANLKRE